MHSLREKFYSFLRKTEKYTKTDMVYLARGGFWLGIGHFFSSASAFIVAVAFANLLPKETYGMYRYILSIFSILLIPTLTGMDTAVTQAISRGHEAVFRKAFRVKTLWGILGTVGSLGVALYYFWNANYTLAFSFSAIAVFIPFIESLDMYNALLQGRQAFSKFTAYNSLTQILSAAILIGSAFLTTNVVFLVLMYVAANTLLNLIFYTLTIRQKSIPTGDGPESAEVIRYGKHLSVMDIFNTGIGQLDKILVFHYLGAIDLAIYSFAIAPPEQLKGLLKNIQFLALPKLAQRTKEEVQKTLISRLLRFSIIIIPCIVFYILIAPYVFNIFFKQYTDAIFYSQLISVSLLFSVLSMVPYTFLQAQAATKQLYKFNFYSNVATIVILFPLVFYWGLLGAIVARIVIRFVVLVSSVVLALER
jgi:O-antigen/teichoic acid export membrane protein